MFVIVCVLDAKYHSVFASAASVRLIEAMSEAYLRAVTALKVKKLQTLQARFDDIENNAEELSFMDTFQIEKTLLAGRLPEDFTGSASKELRLLRQAFQRNHQELKLINLTTPLHCQKGYFVIAAKA